MFKSSQAVWRYENRKCDKFGLDNIFNKPSLLDLWFFIPPSLLSCFEHWFCQDFLYRLKREKIAIPPVSSPGYPQNPCFHPDPTKYIPIPPNTSPSHFWLIKFHSILISSKLDLWFLTHICRSCYFFTQIWSSHQIFHTHLGTCNFFTHIRSSSNFSSKVDGLIKIFPCS